MKKTAIWIGLVVVIVLGASWFLFANKIGDKNDPLRIADYYPLQENVRYVYEGKGNEYASYDVFIDYLADGRIQQRVNNGGSEVVRVLELKNGQLTKLLSKGEIYYRENFLNTSGENPGVLLMEPLAVGTTWKLPDSSVRKITGTAVDVSTPAGNYKAIEVTTEGQYSKTVDYYAKGMGLVKTVFNPGDNAVISSLSKIEQNVPLVQTVSFFYPNGDEEKIYSVDKQVSFKTNDVTRRILETAYKETPLQGLGKVFSANTTINSLYLNSDGIVYIDLNSAFVKEMNAGSAYEGMILQSVADTFGKYYQAAKVILTIDGKLYESGHFAFKQGEALTVKLEETTPITK